VFYSIDFSLSVFGSVFKKLNVFHRSIQLDTTDIIFYRI